MSDEVFSPLLPVVVPDLSCPPPGWSGGVKYRGRRSEEAAGHPTRVIRRTDLRAKISGNTGTGGGGQKHNNKPPRFSNLGRRSSWGEEWRPEKTTVVEGGEMTEGRDDSDSGGEGEWKQVKGRRWNGGKEENKKSPRTTPEPPAPLNGKSQRNRKSPPGLARKSPDFGKSPPGLARKSPPGLGRKSPEDRRSPPGLVRKSPESTKPSIKSSGVNEKPGKPVSRRGSSSSYDGEFPSLAVKSKVSPPPRQPEGKQKDLMQNIPLMFVSDLPDEQSVRDFQKRRISDIKSQNKPEEGFPLQREILNFLRRSWQETCRELEENSHCWPPKIVYYV